MTANSPLQVTGSVPGRRQVECRDDHFLPHTASRQPRRGSLTTRWSRPGRPDAWFRRDRDLLGFL